MRSSSPHPCRRLVQSPDSEERLQRLRRWFARSDGQRGVYTITAVGEFIPSSLHLVDAAIREFIRLGLLDPTAPFLDAGCGDGRIVALLAAVHGIPAAGVEYDEDLFQVAKEHLNRLHGAGFEVAAPVTLALGDFIEDATYLEAGLRFEGFGVIFNYINNHLKIARKIARQSPSGTRFLLYYPSPQPERLDGLIWEHSFVGNGKLSQVSGPCQGTAIHLYRKP
jgi:SAM-dependent methyltransferase